MKNKRRRRKGGRKILPIIIFILFAVTAISIIINLPVFKIVKVEVLGCRLLSPEIIIRMAQIPIGDNIILTNFDKAQKKIRSIPSVKKVKIIRRIPDTVLIKITERREAAVTVIDSQSFLVDDEGVILNPQSQEARAIELPDISNLPVLLGIRKDFIDDGYKLKGEVGESASKLLLEFKNYISPRKLEIDMTDSNNINLMLDDTLKVKFGSNENIDYKLKTFEALYGRLKEKKEAIEYVDVGCPDFPAVKFKQFQKY